MNRLVSWGSGYMRGGDQHRATNREVKGTSWGGWWWSVPFPKNYGLPDLP